MHTLQHGATPESSSKQTDAAATSGPASAPFAVLGHRLGNGDLRRTLQAKLTVSAPQDAFEQEADRVADQVMRMPDTQTVARSSVQIQRVCDKCEKELHRSEDSASSVPNIDAATEQSIAALSGRGKPLPTALLSFMEPRFNADFSAVRVHTGAQAQDLARSVNAKAFTVGHNVVFGAGHYAPETEEGKHLLAHELTHVLQQGSAPKVQRSPADKDPLPAPRPRGLSLLAPDPRQFDDSQFDPDAASKREEAAELAQARAAEIARFKTLTVDWSKADQEFGLKLLLPLIQKRTNIDPRAISDHIRQPILDRYRAWLKLEDAARLKRCIKADGVTGVLVKIGTKVNPAIDFCRSWFTDDFSHGPTELQSLERVLKIDRLDSSGTETPAEYIFWDVQQYRKRTDPLLLKQRAIAGGIVNKTTSFATVLGDVPLTGPPSVTPVAPGTPEISDPAEIGIEELPPDMGPDAPHPEEPDFVPEQVEIHIPGEGEELPRTDVDPFGPDEKTEEFEKNPL